MLHGAIGSAAQLDNLSLFLEEHFNVYSFNFSGHGGAMYNGSFSIERFSGELEAFITENEIDAPHIFGYSMGGYVALKLALRKSGLLGKVVTLGTKFYWDETTAAKEVKMLNPDKIEEKIPQFAQVLKGRHAPLDWKDVLKETAAMMLSLGNDNALTADDYNEIDVQTLVLLGEFDQMVTKEETVLVANNLPNGTFEELKNAKHPIEQVDQRQLASRIQSFILE